MVAPIFSLKYVALGSSCNFMLSSIGISDSDIAIASIWENPITLFELKDILGKDAGKIMESVEPITEKNYFGHKVDPGKFATYMKFVKINKLEEPTVRMIQQMVFDEKGKRLSTPMQYMLDRLKQDLKNPKYKQRQG